MDENECDRSKRSLSAMTQTVAHYAWAASPCPSPSMRPAATAIFENWAFRPFVSAIDGRVTVFSFIRRHYPMVLRIPDTYERR